MPGTTSLRILIVDDAAVECDVFAHIARDLGHEVVGAAADLASATQLAASLAPEIIVLDGRFPPTGPLDALAGLRAAAPRAVIAIIAAPGELEVIRSARAAGAAGAFRRPLLSTQVAVTLRELATLRGPGAL
jgi:two-component system nitrate/nitrite response regulator NarL